MTPREIIARAPRVPTPSAPVLRLLRLLGQPFVDAEGITAIVRQDAALTAKLLAFCNAAATGLPTRVASVDEAVFYLGHGEVQRLVISLGLGTAVRPKLPGYLMPEGALWQHTLFTAHLTSKVLGRAEGLCTEPELAYTAGLLHDLGKLVFSHALDQPTRDAVRAQVQQHHLALVQAEHRVLGTDHAEVGARLLEDWNLPEVIVTAVAHHHRPTAGGRPSLAAVVHVADLLAHEAGSAPGMDGLAVAVDEGALVALNLSADAMQELLMDAFDVAGEVDKLISQT
ncbi:MAG: hypothetical protein RL514_1613 [Verrucomicrobiota bacterium]|jgi:putative nucleotidyltransferase with HDIG domain